MVKFERLKSDIINALMPYQPFRIGFSGSHARNEQTYESDLDILFSVKEAILK